MSKVQGVYEEHDYIGLSEVSVHEQASDKTRSSGFSEKNNSNVLNFKATELRLGLPGSDSPDREAAVVGDGVDNDRSNKDGCTYKVGKINSLVSGAKRGFSDAINGGSGAKNVSNDSDKKLQSLAASVQGTSAVTPKAQVVGWPPIRSYRKNCKAINTPKNDDSKDSKTESGCLFVKVSMDGAPYLRKVNLGTYGGYVELSTALEKMFRGFTMGQVDFKKCRLMDNLRNSEFVLTYEDKDSDWMLVGDVPWKMFQESCRRMRIMKSSDAVGLASKASEECFQSSSLRNTNYPLMNLNTQT